MISTINPVYLNAVFTSGVVVAVIQPKKAKSPTKKVGDLTSSKKALTVPMSPF